MELLVKLAGALAAVIFLAAAFVYVFDPPRARALLKNGLVPLALLFVLFVLVDRLAGSNRLMALAGLALVSVTAYWIREHRLGRRETPRKPGKAERTPVLPHAGEDE